MKNLFTLITLGNYLIRSLAFALVSLQAFSQTISIAVDANQGQTKISPWIYGKNNNLSNESSSPLPAATWQKYKDAGLRMYRDNGGNNATKYNWKLKISSHPDWYNNVYSEDWNYAATSLLSNTTNTQGLFAFQLLGKVASNKNNNFDDWSYNQSQWWSGTSNNWAGGGGPSGNGDSNKYLKSWVADSSVAILDYWFKTLHLDSTRLRYWNMDNEPEIWSGTHDDAIGAISAEEFIQKYFLVAKAARKKFPGVKLVGPVSPNEWQWYNWNNSKVTDPKDGKAYCWTEYFIKRIGEEQKASGIRLLDVLDFHFYPGTSGKKDLTLQLHRIWFDTQWDYPGANGVKVVGPTGWDNGITKEYFFERCNQWLTKYLGATHKVTLGISEYGSIDSSDPNVVACWYASNLGVFANKGVELFTPWDWYVGQWEVMNLFSNYYGKFAVGATSSDETTVSAYSSLSAKKDSLIIAIVNRDMTTAKNVDINIQNFTPSATTVKGYQLANLGTTETFVSKSNNALQAKQFTISGTHLTFSVPKLSITLIQIPTTAVVLGVEDQLKVDNINVFPNPAKDNLSIVMDNKGGGSVILRDIMGKSIIRKNIKGSDQLEIGSLPKGTYLLEITQGKHVTMKKFIKE